ncbi:MAG: hypothetical protein ACK41U_07220 [Paracoccus sp. (in: a-proteobacteria)]|uniref:hypothetical protein n=1 Tax=Paracoccus sp. TaxID=267 RepID=UPI00391CC123
MTVWPSTIHDEAEWKRILDELCKPIPARGLLQTKEARERWTIGHALHASPGLFGARFPSEIRHGDAPDFVLRYGQRIVGVEVVEAIPCELAHAYAVVNRSDDGSDRFPSVLSFSDFRSDEVRKTQAEVIETACDFSGSEPWLGDEPERHWVDFVSRAICRKIQKQKTGNYSSVSELHLLIADEVGGPANVDKAWQRLVDNERLMADAASSFAAIHVLSQRMVHSIPFRRSC